VGGPHSRSRRRGEGTIRDLFPPGVKRQGREADQLHSTSAETKKTYKFLHSPIHLHSVVLSIYISLRMLRLWPVAVGTDRNGCTNL
jgi:hypothetical protein